MQPIMNQNEQLKEIFHQRGELLEKLIKQATGFTDEQVKEHQGCFCRIEWTNNRRTEIQFMGRRICWVDIRIEDEKITVEGGLL